MSPAPTTSPHAEDHTELARAVAELRQLKFSTPPKGKRAKAEIDAMLRGAAGPLVDATFVYKTWKGRENEDVSRDQFPSIKPPWGDAFIGYVNNERIPYVAWVKFVEADERTGPFLADDGRPIEYRNADGTVVVEGHWAAVILLFVDARRFWPNSGTGMVGPVAIVKLLIAEDGALIWNRRFPINEADDCKFATWPLITVLGTLSLLNSTNCSLVEAPLPRSLRRAEQRYGVRSHVIQVTTKNRSTRSGRAGEPSTITYPLTSVRGHHAHYGDCCPRYHEPKGLLFGKLTGRVWVPQYARGDESVGHVDQTFMMGASA